MNHSTTREQLLQLFRYFPNYGLLYWRRRRGGISRTDIPAGGVDLRGYRHVKILGKVYRIHRLVWLIETGEWPEGDLDHIDQNKANNRFSNLRAATRSQNMSNRGIYRNNTSGFKGVGWHKANRKWRARVTVRGVQHFVGWFDCPEEAAHAYDEAAIRLYGEFAVTNFREGCGRAVRQPPPAINSEQ